MQSLPVHHGVYFTPPSEVGQTKQLSNGPSSPRKPQPLVCLGFMFDDSIVYLSDVSEIPERTWELLLNRRPGCGEATNGGLGGSASSSGHLTDLHALDDSSGSGSPPAGKESSPAIFSPVAPVLNNGGATPRLPILIVDALWPLRPHLSHYSFVQALETMLRLQPSISYLVDSTHPTTHFMWEELCLSVRGQEGTRDHPDSEITKGARESVLGEPGFRWWAWTESGRVGWEG